MKTAPKTASRQRLQNLFGILGYIALLLQWLWVAILLVPPLLQMPLVSELIIPETKTPIEQPTRADEVPWPLVIGAVAVSLLIVAVGLVAAARAPKAAVDMTSRTIHHGATATARKIYHHSKPSKAELFQLSEQLVWYGKLGLVAIAYGLSLIATQLDPDLEPQLIIVIASFLAIWPIVWFVTQRAITSRNQTAF